LAKIEDAIPFKPGPDDCCKSCHGDGTIYDSECCEMPEKDSEGNINCCGQPVRFYYDCSCIAMRELKYKAHLEEVEKQIEEVLLGKSGD
jgi:hypothetical protein